MHHSTTRLCSSWLTVGLSPVVPTGTRPWVPSAICQLTKARKAASSSEPFLNGVTKAVNEPRKFVLAAMDFLRTRGFYGFAVGPPLHTGSEGQAKDPHRPGHSRDFAGLRAHTQRSPPYLVFCPHIQSNRPKASTLR